MRHFEDIEVGESKTLGTETLSQDEIIDFASEWDPQDYHTDPEAAKESVHGGIIASGSHTVAVAIREWVEEDLDDVKNMGAREIRSLTWERAIRPGEELEFRVEVLDKEPDEYNPTHGFVEYELSVHVDGEEVISMISEQVIGTREVWG